MKRGLLIRKKGHWWRIRRVPVHFSNWTDREVADWKQAEWDTIVQASSLPKPPRYEPWQPYRRPK